MADGQKIELTEASGFSYIVFKKNDTQIVSEKLAAVGAELEDFRPIDFGPIDFGPDQKILSDCWWAVATASLDDVNKIEELVYSAPLYRNSQGKAIGLGAFMNVYLKNANDFSTLKRLADETNVIILNNGSFEYGYELVCTEDSKGNALQIANWLYETGLLESFTQSFLKRNDDLWWIDSPPVDTGIKIEGGWIVSPEWLAEEVIKTAGPVAPGTGRPMYRSVSLFKYDGQYHLMLDESFDSYIYSSKLFYTLSGERPIKVIYPPDAVDELWWELYEASKDSSLIWSHSLQFEWDIFYRGKYSDVS